MFIGKVDITQNEIPRPIDNRCDGCENPALEFKRQGPGSEPQPTRFYKVTADSINGIYCEPCLVVAHYIAGLKRKVKQGKIGKTWKVQKL